MRKGRNRLQEIIGFLLCMTGMAGWDGDPTLATVILLAGGVIIVGQAKKEGAWK